MRTILSLTAAVFVFANPAGADIYQWEYINPADPGEGKRQSTTLAPDGAGVDAAPGAYIEGRDLSMAYLMNADVRDAYFIESTLTNAEFSGANLSNTKFGDVDLTGASFRGAKLSHSLFGFCHGDAICAQRFATLTEADFTDAEVMGANFAAVPSFLLSGTGITLSQLYSTASYRASDLTGIGLGGNVLSGGNFTGQNLTNASFATWFCGSSYCPESIPAALTDADFTAADARGSDLLTLVFHRPLPWAERVLVLVGAGAVHANLIQADGDIHGLNLEAGDRLVVRDYDGDPRYASPPIPIAVEEHMTMGPGGTLRLVFETDTWDSTISFAPGIPVTLGGTLELTFAADVNIASQRGRTFDLFNWTGVNPTGTVTVSSPYRWELANLYTTGEVTLIAVPEPSAIMLLLVGAIPWFMRRGSGRPGSLGFASRLTNSSTSPVILAPQALVLKFNKVEEER